MWKSFEKILERVFGLLDNSEHGKAENLKSLFVDKVKNLGNNNHEIVFSNCTYYFDADSWSRARAAGHSFEGMLSHCKPRTFKVLYEIGQVVPYVQVSSLWRPWGGSAHPAGIGIDIVKLGDIVTARDRMRPEPVGLPEIRKAIFASRDVRQWIGPWWINTGGGWYKNTASTRNNGPGLDRQHIDHIHITVRG